jgi:hypothetical protein
MSKLASGFSREVGHLPHQLKAMGLSPRINNDILREKRQNKYSSQYQFLQHSGGTLVSSSVTTNENKREKRKISTLLNASFSSTVTKALPHHL